MKRLFYASAIPLVIAEELFVICRTSDVPSWPLDKTKVWPVECPESGRSHLVEAVAAVAPQGGSHPRVFNENISVLVLRVLLKSVKLSENIIGDQVINAPLYALFSLETHIS